MTVRRVALLVTSLLVFACGDEDSKDHTPEEQTPDLSAYDKDRAECSTLALTYLSSVRGYSYEERRRIAGHIYETCMDNKGNEK